MILDIVNYGLQLSASQIITMEKKKKNENPLLIYPAQSTCVEF